MQNLRSHGSVHEQVVPMLLSKPLTARATGGDADADAILDTHTKHPVPGHCAQRNWDLFDLALNHV